MAKSHKICMEQAEIIDTFGTYQRPSPWPRHLPSWMGPTSPRALLWPYLFSQRRNPRIEVTFPIYIAEPPQPSVLPLGGGTTSRGPSMIKIQMALERATHKQVHPRII